MAAENLVLTVGKTRSWKILRLIVDGGTLVLKYTFDKGTSHRKAFLSEEKNNLLGARSKNALTKTQYDLLYPTSGSSSSADYDITLLVALHRTCLCSKKENDPVWRFGNTPHQNDHSVEADIVRLRDSRNEFLHQPIPELTKKEFDTKWQDVCQVLLRLGQGMPDLKETLERLRFECFDKEYEKQLLTKLVEWNELDKSFGDEIMKRIEDN
ncbi:E3 ubiquitin-protein ligase DZIP3-like, partial [Ruditapes philippinarum]|uniref:E3 ubiquitin-protein ligase DZIP3-like n=1 Tax=Ruditapes philippinarum TaxID=129788 RepID=UPI00295AD6DF